VDTYYFGVLTRNAPLTARGVDYCIKEILVGLVGIQQSYHYFHFEAAALGTPILLDEHLRSIIIGLRIDLRELAAVLRTMYFRVHPVLPAGSTARLPGRYVLLLLVGLRFLLAGLDTLLGALLRFLHALSLLGGHSA
jgi:hypothetical protein